MLQAPEGHPARLLRRASSGCSSAQGELDMAFYGTSAAPEPVENLFHLQPGYAHQGESVTYLTKSARNDILLRVQGGCLVDANGASLAPEQPRAAMFVMDATGDVLIAFMDNDADGQLCHASLVEGGPVAAAGIMTISQGRLICISNESGHYRPPPSSLQVVIRRLASMQLDGISQMRLDPVLSEAHHVSEAFPLAAADWPCLQPPVDG